jgi:uncharacterized protein YegJ (DUF2314 family)
MRQAMTDNRQPTTMKPSPAVLLLIVVSLCGCPGGSQPETLIRSGYDEQEMDAAIARARSEVDVFIAELSKPTGTDHCVKVPITDNGETEHFWLINITYANDQFDGEIGNDPGIVKNVEFGQKWTVKKDEISDWLYMRDGKMHGNYTMRPLMKNMPAEEAAKMRQMLAEP